jgi:hypothetical protein
MVPLYTLGEVAQLIATEKTGGYLNRWSQKPNALDPILGVSALNHFFLKFKLLQAAPDITTAFGDIFAKKDDFLSRLKEKPFTTGDNIGHWIKKSILEDPTCETSLYEQFGTADSVYDESSRILLFQYLSLDLAILAGHKLSAVLRNFLQLEVKTDGSLKGLTTTVTTQEGDQTHTEVRPKYPYIEIGDVDDDKIGADKIQIHQDWSADANLGQPAGAIPAANTPEDMFRKHFFVDVLASLGKKENFKVSSNDLTRPTQMTLAFAKELGKINRPLTLRLISWLVGFSKESVQDYATNILKARRNALAGEELFSAFEESIGPDGAPANDGPLDEDEFTF